MLDSVGAFMFSCVSLEAHVAEREAVTWFENNKLNQHVARSRIYEYRKKYRYL